MATRWQVIGVDPGATTGIVALIIRENVILHLDMIQCNAGAARLVVEALVTKTPTCGLMAIEKFVVSPRAGRSTHAAAGAVTRELITELSGLAELYDYNIHTRAAGVVKPWASDERLEAAGLVPTARGMSHARDAARHALFAAVRDGGLPDPLSKKNRETA